MVLIYFPFWGRIGQPNKPPPPTNNQGFWGTGGGLNKYSLDNLIISICRTHTEMLNTLLPFLLRTMLRLNVGDHVMPHISVVRSSDYFLCPDVWLYLFMLSRHFILCLPFARSPRIFPASTMLSCCPFLITCPSKLSCLFLINLIIVLVVPIRVSTSSLVTRSVQLLCNSLL